MTHTATGLDNAWAIITTTKPTVNMDELRRRRQEDFMFMVLCESKKNMSMYRLMRDTWLDQYKDIVIDPEVKQ